MNRRGFFSFLPSAAVGVAAGVNVAPAAAPPQHLVRTSPNGHKCGCGCAMYRMNTVVERQSHEMLDGSRSVSESTFYGPVCVWCSQAWKGPVVFL